MANKVTGWKGSGTRPGTRRRRAGKGTVYWIDLDSELDEKFIAFAKHHGMERRAAAKGLMAHAMGLLPPNFWEDSDDGGFTGPERMNLVAQIFPKGSGHTNRAPHPQWKTTWDPRHFMRDSPGGISWVGLLVERELLKWKDIKDGSSAILDHASEEERIRLKQEAEIQLKRAAEQRRAHLLERGVIDDPTSPITAARKVRRKKLALDSPDVDPYERERQKNAAEIDAIRNRDPVTRSRDLAKTATAKQKDQAKGGRKRNGASGN